MAMASPCAACGELALHGKVTLGLEAVSLEGLASWRVWHVRCWLRALASSPEMVDWTIERIAAIEAARGDG